MVQLVPLILKGLLGVMWIVPVWSFDEMCTRMENVNELLSSSLRRRYSRHNFPINYTIQVHYDEIFRMRNISRLKCNHSANDVELQLIWFYVSNSTVGKISQVLPERHPSHKYLTNLTHHLKDLIRIYEYSHRDQQKTDIQLEFLERWGELKTQGWRSVTPKLLLDNSFKTMCYLFRDCFKSQDRNSSCSFSCDIHRRKNNGTEG